MLSASEKYAKEATAVWAREPFRHLSCSASTSGVRRPSASWTRDLRAAPAGARTFADGIDVGGEIPNPIGRMANVETTEATFPVRYLFRRRARIPAGPAAGAAATRSSFALGAARVGPRRHQLRGLRQGHRVFMSEGLGGAMPRLSLGAQQRGQRDRTQRQSLPHLARRDDRQGRGPFSGAVSPLRERTRSMFAQTAAGLRRPAGAGVRAGAADIEAGMVSADERHGSTVW